MLTKRQFKEQGGKHTSKNICIYVICMVFLFPPPLLWYCQDCLTTFEEAPLSQHLDLFYLILLRYLWSRYLFSEASVEYVIIEISLTRKNMEPIFLKIHCNTYTLIMIHCRFNVWNTNHLLQWNCNPFCVFFAMYTLLRMNTFNRKCKQAGAPHWWQMILPFERLFVVLFLSPQSSSQEMKVSIHPLAVSTIQQYI